MAQPVHAIYCFEVLNATLNHHFCLPLSQVEQYYEQYLSAMGSKQQVDGEHENIMNGEDDENEDEEDEEDDEAEGGGEEDAETMDEDENDRDDGGEEESDEDEDIANTTLLPSTNEQPPQAPLQPKPQHHNFLTPAPPRPHVSTPSTTGSSTPSTPLSGASSTAAASATSSRTSLSSRLSSSLRSSTTASPATPPQSTSTSMSTSRKKTVYPSHPIFITWSILRNPRRRHSEREKTLRGCIGTFDPQPLDQGLRDYALTSALEDTRFPPIPSSLLPQLHCSVTLLTNFENTADPLDWEIGTHGLRISFSSRGRRYGATYLPDVCKEQGWNKRECLGSLMRKAGWSGSGSSGNGYGMYGGGGRGNQREEWEMVDNFRVVRYQGKKSGLGYGEWMDWREWVEGTYGAF